MKVKCLLIGIVVLFIVGLLASSSYAKVDPKTCVGMWLFDEGSGTIAKDSSGNKNDGKFVGMPKWVDGKFGKALEFDSVDDYVSIPENDILDPASISIEAWVKIPALPTILGNIVEKGGNSGYRFRINNDGIVGWSDRGATNWLNSVGTVPIDVWTHIAVVGSSSGLRIYINGESSGSNSNAYGSPNTTDILTIGVCTEFSEYFKGIIDEVAVFNEVLTEQDINSIMTQGLERALGITAVSPSGKLATTWASIKAQD